MGRNPYLGRTYDVIERGYHPNGGPLLNGEDMRFIENPEVHTSGFVQEEFPVQSLKSTAKSKSVTTAIVTTGIDVDGVSDNFARYENGKPVSKFSYETKDSGSREKFETGSQRDSRVGKGRFDLISPIALRRISGVYERGAIKYDEWNWSKGQQFSRLMDSALRHLNEYREGMRDEDHLAQAAWNILSMLHFDEAMPEMNDLPRFCDENGKYVKGVKE